MARRAVHPCPVYSAVETPSDDERLERIRENGLRYLRGEPVILLSTTLKFGPLTPAAGWQNPWRERSRAVGKEQQEHVTLARRQGEHKSEASGEIAETDEEETPTTSCHLPSPDSLKPDHDIDQASFTRVTAWIAHVKEKKKATKDEFWTSKTPAKSDCRILKRKRAQGNAWLHRREPQKLRLSSPGPSWPGNTVDADSTTDPEFPDDSIQNSDANNLAANKGVVLAADVGLSIAVDFDVDEEPTADKDPAVYQDFAADHSLVDDAAADEYVVADKDLVAHADSAAEEQCTPQAREGPRGRHEAHTAKQSAGRRLVFQPSSSPQSPPPRSKAFSLGLTDSPARLDTSENRNMSPYASFIYLSTQLPPDNVHVDFDHPEVTKAARTLQAPYEILRPRVPHNLSSSRTPSRASFRTSNATRQEDRKEEATGPSVVALADLRLLGDIPQLSPFQFFGIEPDTPHHQQPTTPAPMEQQLSPNEEGPALAPQVIDTFSSQLGDAPNCSRNPRTSQPTQSIDTPGNPLRFDQSPRRPVQRLSSGSVRTVASASRNDTPGPSAAQITSDEGPEGGVKLADMGNLLSNPRAVYSTGFVDHHDAHLSVDLDDTPARPTSEARTANPVAEAGSGEQDAQPVLEYGGDGTLTTHVATLITDDTDSISDLSELDDDECMELETSNHETQAKEWTVDEKRPVETESGEHARSKTCARQAKPVAVAATKPTESDQCKKHDCGGAMSEDEPAYFPNSLRSAATPKPPDLRPSQQSPWSRATNLSSAPGSSFQSDADIAASTPDSRVQKAKQFGVRKDDTAMSPLSARTIESRVTMSPIKLQLQSPWDPNAKSAIQTPRESSSQPARVRILCNARGQSSSSSTQIDPRAGDSQPTPLGPSQQTPWDDLSLGVEKGSLNPGDGNSRRLSVIANQAHGEGVIQSPWQGLSQVAVLPPAVPDLEFSSPKPVVSQAETPWTDSSRNILLGAEGVDMGTRADSTPSHDGPYRRPLRDVSNTQHVATSTKKRKRVSFAMPLGSDDPKVSPPRRQKHLEQGLSPPPFVDASRSFSLPEPVEDHRFANHFATVRSRQLALRSCLHPRPRGARLLLSESQQTCPSPGFEAMAEAFVHADTHAVPRQPGEAPRVWEDRSMEAETGRHVSLDETVNADTRMVDDWEERALDDVSAVLDNLDDFLNCDFDQLVGGCPDEELDAGSKERGDGDGAGVGLGDISGLMDACVWD